VNHIFMIYLPLLCGRPEVLQGDSSFKVCQDYPLPCPRWFTLGCKCTRTSKHRRGQKTSYLRFGRERCTSEISFGETKSNNYVLLRSCPFPLSRRRNIFSFSL